MRSIRVGVSTCLLGEEVRYNGGHKKDSFIVDILSEYFEWVSICPEVEIGLGIPREPIRLVGNTDKLRLLGTTNPELDFTDRMNEFSRAKVLALMSANIHGYILKKDSPSCGMERVKVYSEKGMPEKKGVGLFARVLMEMMPLLPVEEEGRLSDLPIRENFITRVFCYYRWRTLLFSGLMLLTRST